MPAPPIVIGPFDNVPAPGSPIRSNWPQEITQYVVDRAPPVVLPLVSTPVSSNLFTLPADSAHDRLWMMSWSWWASGMTANGVMRAAFLVGGAYTAVYDIPFTASAPPVPTLSATVPYRQHVPRGSALQVEAALTGGNGPWTAAGHITVIGYVLTDVGPVLADVIAAMPADTLPADTRPADDGPP